MVSTLRGSRGKSRRGATGSSANTCTTVSIGDSARNGGRPVSIS